MFEYASLKPEEQARLNIDEMLRRAGWDIVKRDEYSERYNACAIEEALLVGNKEADYLLVLDGKAIGVLEAKRRESSLGGKVSDQVATYSAKVPNWTQTWMKPLPLPDRCPVKPLPGPCCPAPDPVDRNAGTPRPV